MTDGLTDEQTFVIVESLSRLKMALNEHQIDTNLVNADITLMNDVTDSPKFRYRNIMELLGNLNTQYIN